MSDRRQLEGRHDAVKATLVIFGVIIATVLTAGLTAVGVILTLHWWSN